MAPAKRRANVEFVGFHLLFHPKRFSGLYDVDRLLPRQLQAHAELTVLEEDVDRTDLGLIGVVAFSFSGELSSLGLEETGLLKLIDLPVARRERDAEHVAQLPGTARLECRRRENPDVVLIHQDFW